MIKLIDILNKYDTDINIESIGSDLKNKVLFDNEKDDFFTAKDFGKVTLDDIKKPKYEKTGDVEKYEYQIKEGTLEIRYNPNNYRTMLVTLKIPTEEQVPEPFYVWSWNYDGSSNDY